MNSIKHFKLFRFHLIKTNPAPAKAQLGIFKLMIKNDHFNNGKTRQSSHCEVNEEIGSS